MTANEARLKFCAWLTAQIGTREGANNWNKYAENALLKKLYGWYAQNQPWCDIFYDVGMIECFGLEAASAMTYQPIGAGSALCRQSAQYYKDNGAFFKTPEIGDQIFFYVGGEINHTGAVVRVAGGSVVTVEGNSSDMVAERVYSVGDSKIAGYGRPKWDEAGDPSVSEADSSLCERELEEDRYYELRLPYLKRGDLGLAVVAVQLQLVGRGLSVGPDGADGDFGENTEAAVKALQRNYGLTEDGVVGPDTGAALFCGEVFKVSTKEEEET